MKRFSILAAFVLVLALAAQAVLAQMESTAPKGQMKAPGEKATTDVNKDAEFLKEAASGGMLEVKLGNLAAQSAADDSVKAFAQRMVTDHGKVNDELQALAQAKGITLPAEMNKAHMAEYNSLSKKTGAALDKAYVLAVVKAHSKDVAEFRKMAKSATDPDIKAFASKTLPALEMHLTMAKALDKKLTGGKMGEMTKEKMKGTTGGMAPEGK